MVKSSKRLGEVECDRGIGQYGDFQDPTIEDSWRFQSRNAEGPGYYVSLNETFGTPLLESTAYYINVDIILLCFSVEDPRSFESVAEKWAPDLQNHGLSARIILVGTKSDLQTSDDVIEALRARHQAIIQPSQGAALANKIGALGYVACSARTGEGVERLEELIVHEGRRIDADKAVKIEAARKKKRKRSFCDIM
ncbi:P-loop containing nucleoside triphosphate hydrolase protein [Flagelloscypha sp. PMI_526]|nr:P-loop containing nucleoside triphosphate hydrolase protein [Flagelloscypha sp. PMI_526]